MTTIETHADAAGESAVASFFGAVATWATTTDSKRIGRIYPALAGLKPAFAWGGMVDMTPDAIPVLSPIGRQPGLYVCSGFSAHGFGIGPGAGLLMADLVTGARPVVDPQPFRYERMVDGTDFGQPGMI